MAAYELRWPIGTRQRVWLHVPPAYTGLRRGDVVRIGRPHVRGQVATIKTEKSGFTVTVTLPILPALAKTLAAGPWGDLTFITGANGKPLTKESSSAMPFAKLAMTPAFRGRRTACERLRRRARRRTEPRCRSLTPSSAGWAPPWRCTIPAKPIG